MIQMRERDQMEPVLFRKLLKQEHQRDGVGAPGQPNQQSGTRRTEPVWDRRESAEGGVKSNSQLRSQPVEVGKGLDYAGGRTRTADPALMRRVL